MFPIFTICFGIFLVVLNYRIRKGYTHQNEVENEFWERERQANLTRRQDISNLDYINIPEDLFPMNLHTDTENEIASLRNVKLLNLTGLSNTDLKLQYGVQNLEELSEYDDNFTKFVRLLPNYVDELLAAEQWDDAKRLLEFAVKHKADSKAIFCQLARIYKEDCQEDKIQHLILIAGELNSLSQLPIISALQELQNKEPQIQELE